MSRYASKQDYVFCTLRAALESTGAFITDNADEQLLSIAEEAVLNEASDIEIPPDTEPQ